MLELARLAYDRGDDARACTTARSRGQWRADVAWASGALCALPDGPVALFHGAAYEFSVWLFAAWHAGRCVRLPTDRGSAAAAALPGAIVLGEIEGATLREWPRDGAVPELQPLDSNLPALQVYTSGSTGEPKTIAKCLAQLECEVAAIEAFLGPQLPTGAEVATTVSHQHMYGLAFRLLWPLASTRALREPPLRLPTELARLGREHLLVTSPAFLKRLDGARGTLGAVLSSGGPLPDETAAMARECLDAPLLEVYGSSETGAIAWRRTPAVEWQPLPGVQTRISADGLLEIRSPFLTDAQWHTSADRARGTPAFELFGRADRIVKLEDRRVSLTAIETELCDSGLVAEARTLMLEFNRATIGAVIVLDYHGRAAYRTRGRAALIATLRAALASRLDPVALPRRWRIVDALPVDLLGKVPHTALERLFDERPQSPLMLDYQRGSDSVTLVLEIGAELRVFDGHFPDTPIVPGVALLHWAMDYARRSFELPPAFLGLRALKFHRVVRPDARLALHLSWRRERSTLEFDYDSAQGKHASGRILLGDRPQ